MKKLLRTIGRFFAGIGRFFQSCGKALAQTLRKPKWRHGGFGTALVCGFIAVCVLLNVAVKSLEDSYGWKLDFSFNGYTSTGAETQKVINTLKDPIKLYLLYSSGDMDSQLNEVLERYHRLTDLITVLPTDIAQNPGILTRFEKGITQSSQSNSVVVSCEATDRYKVLTYDDFVTQGYNVEKGTFENVVALAPESLPEFGRDLRGVIDDFRQVIEGDGVGAALVHLGESLVHRSLGGILVQKVRHAGKLQ